VSGILGWVVGSLGLVLSAIGVWLTVVYGKQATEILRKISVKLGA
jgi:hypothetical protein